MICKFLWSPVLVEKQFKHMSVEPAIKRTLPEKWLTPSHRIMDILNILTSPPPCIYLLQTRIYKHWLLWGKSSFLLSSHTNCQSTNVRYISKEGGLRSGNSTYFSLHEGEETYIKPLPMKILFLIPLTAPNWINGAEALTWIYLYFHHAFRDFSFLRLLFFLWSSVECQLWLSE